MKSVRPRHPFLLLALCGVWTFGEACGSGGDGGASGSGGHGGGAGNVGAAGTGGAIGSAGTTGAAGTTGLAGTTGGAGITGAAGNGGSAGNGGNVGTTGSAGNGGTVGGGGNGGVSGRGGASGASGAGGRGGSAGSGGSTTGVGGAAGSVGGAGGRGGGGGGGNAGRGGGSAGNGGTQDGSVPSDAGRDGSGDGGTAYMPCPTTAGTACAVLPLGDSITEGYLPSGANGGYRVELFNQAVMAGKNVTFVGTQTNGPTMVANRTFPRRHEGHGGYTIAGGGSGALAGTITDTAISMYHPNIVLLMIGTNDINGNITPSSAPTRLGQLIDEITTDAPAALVVVASIIPIRDDGTNQRIPNYNATIPGLVATRGAAGKHVVFVDNYAAFIKDTSYRTSLMVDNLHPNEAGYAVLGRAFYGAISALLPPGP